MANNGKAIFSLLSDM